MNYRFLRRWGQRRCGDRRRVGRFLLIVVTCIFLVVHGGRNVQSIQAQTFRDVSPKAPSTLALHHLEQQKDIDLQNTPATAAAFRQGLAFYEEGDFAKAVAQWEQAILLLRQQDRWVDESLILHYLGLAHQELGQYKNAQDAVNLGLQKIMGIKQPGVQEVFARLLNTQGSLYLKQGQGQLALESWRKAAQTYRQLGDRTGMLGSLINQAQAEQALGYFLRARDTLKQAEQGIATQKDASLRLPLDLSLGQVLTHIGEFRQADIVLANALKVAQEQRNSSFILAILMEQGCLAHAQQKFDAAQSYYQQALQVNSSPQTQIEIELNRFRVFLDQGNWSEAQALWPRLKGMLASRPVNHATLSQRLRLADGLLLLQTTPNKNAASEIATLLVQTVNQSQQLQDTRIETFALGYLGRLYESNQQWPEAERLTRRALAISQAFPDGKYCWQWQLGRIMRSQGKRLPALQFYQRAVETLQSMRQSLVSLPPELQYAFRTQVEPVYRDYIALLLQPSAETPPSQTQLKEAQNVIEALRVAELDYFFRSACLEDYPYRFEPSGIKDTAVVYPILLHNQLDTLIQLPNGSLHLFSQAIKTTDLEQTVQQLRTLLEKPYTAPEGKRLSAQLYDGLLKAAEPLLAQHSIKTLMFVPDGVLRNIPFAALYNGQKFLLEQYGVAITPSLKLLDPNAPSRSTIKALAAGLSKERGEFGPLPFVSDELQAVARQGSGKALLNEQFTSRAIANAVNESSVNTVHLATHGRFSSNIDQTFIMAWDKPITLYDLKDLLEPQQKPLRSRIDLLVLSACETALGDSQSALGLAGIAVQSGTLSTMATLWNVDDESSSVFMKEFYKNLAQPGITKAEALRQTQLTFLKGQDYRDPLHWAAYVLVGDWT